MEETNNVYKIKVPDMTCQHCKMKITQSLDDMPDVKLLSIDLNSKEVAFETQADSQKVFNRLKDEGYHPE